MSNINIWIVITVWIISTFLAFIIGRRKGKPVAGALAGVMFGPIGVIVSFLLGWFRCTNTAMDCIFFVSAIDSEFL